SPVVSPRRSCRCATTSCVAWPNTRSRIHSARRESRSRGPTSATPYEAAPRCSPTSARAAEAVADVRGTAGCEALLPDDWQRQPRRLPLSAPAARGLRPHVEEADSVPAALLSPDQQA